MFRRQTNGSCICMFCNQIVSVNQATCPHCHRKNPSLWGYSRSLRRLGGGMGFTVIVTWGCITLYLITLLMDLSNISNNTESFSFLIPSSSSLIMFGASGIYPVFKLGHWWTILSAGYLHGDLLHIAFNLISVRHLASEVARTFGFGRLVIIYTASIVNGFLLSNLVHFFLLSPIEIAIGASGGVFGLLGALVASKQITWTYAVVIFLSGFLIPNVDVSGHLGGFLGGYLISRISGLNPRYREGSRQLFLAIICLALTALSILASIVYGVISHPIYYS